MIHVNATIMFVSVIKTYANAELVEVIGVSGFGFIENVKSL